MLAPARGGDPVEKLSVAQEIAIRNVGEEIKSLRRENTEVYKAGKDKFSARIYSKPKYYYDAAGDSLALPDLSIHEISVLEKINPFRTHDKYVDAGIYKATWFEDKSYDYTFYKADSYVRYKALYDTTGILIETKAKRDGIKQTITLNNKTATNILKWIIYSDVSYSISNEQIFFVDEQDDFLFRIQKPWAVDAIGEQLPVHVSVDDDTLIYLVDIPEEAVYPVTVDPSTNVADIDAMTGCFSADDATWLTARNMASAENSVPTHIYVGSGTTALNRAFLRFDTSELPDGCTIDSTKMRVVVDTDGSTTDFYMYVVENDGNHSLWNVDVWNDFPGWAASGTYTVTHLADTLTSNGISPGDTLTFTFNSDGKSKVSDTDTTAVAILSSRDIVPVTPSDEEYVIFEDDSPYLEIYYRSLTPPANFSMTALDPYTIACAWEDSSDNEEKFYIINIGDMSVVDSTAANAEADTISALSENTKYVWKVAADSAGVRGYSDPDSTYTLLNPPTILDITIIPISSDTLRISVAEPPNGTADSTGMEVYAVSGSGATSSGWLTGEYSYLDGGLNPDSTYVYKIRYRNGDGDSTIWSPSISYGMKGLDTLMVNLAGDIYDDYNVDFGNGQRDSTVIRIGASDSGDRLDGFVSFTLPWSVANGGVDSLFLRMTRTDERSSGTPAISVYGIPVRHDDPIEERTLGSQDSTTAAIDWTVQSGTGERTSPDLRIIFREWQDITGLKNFTYDFGFKLDDSSQADSVRAVFLDNSHPSYSNSTFLTIYYTPGDPDSVEYAPGDFSLTVLAPDSINASWSDNSVSEYGYVLLNLSDSTKVSETDTLAQNTISVDVGGLTPNTVYEWFVRAYATYNDSSSSSVSERTFARIPGKTTTSALSDTTLHFIINPVDNPSWTAFAVQDSITGNYVDGAAEPDTLRPGPPGEWGWRTYQNWGSAAGDTLSGLMPDSLYVLRAKARRDE